MRRLLLVFLCLTLLVLPVSAAEDNVNTLTMEVTVGTDGTCSVRATANVAFQSAPAEFAFPLNARAGEVTVSGGSYETERRSGVDYIIFSNPSGFSGSQTFVCSYTLPCAVTNVEDGQQFLLNLIDGGWDYTISSFSLTMTFASTIPVQPTWDSAFHGEIIDNSLTIKVTDKTLRVNSVQPLIDHETLTMGLLFPEETFTIVHLAGRTLSFSQIAFIILLALSVLYWFFFLRRRLLLAGHQPSPGTDATAGEIPCQLFGEPADVAATLAHWGDLGYLSIHRGRNTRILLRKQMEMGNERKPAELKLFQAIFRKSDTCDAQSLRFRSVAVSASAPLRSGWIRRIFRRKAGNPNLLRVLSLLAGFFISMATFDLILPERGLRWIFLPLLSLLSLGLCYGVQYGVAGIYRRHRGKRALCGLLCAAVLVAAAWISETIGWMLMNLLLQIFCAVTTMFGGRRTKAGEDYVCQILGLRRYLHRIDSEAALQLVESDSQYFYRMLPFAEILGVGKHFSKQFSRWKPEPCAWLTDASFRPASATEFYALYEDLMNTIRDEKHRKK